MNTIDYTVVKIIKEPYQVIDKENCHWEMVIEVDSWGGHEEKTVSFSQLSQAWKIGHKYLA